MPAIAIAVDCNQKQYIDKITDGYTSMSGTLLYLAGHIGVNCPICESPITGNRNSDTSEKIFYLLMVDSQQDLAKIFGKCIRYGLTRVLVDSNARSLLSKHIFKCPSCDSTLQSQPTNLNIVKKEVFSSYRRGLGQDQHIADDYEEPSTSPTEEHRNTETSYNSESSNLSFPNQSTNTLNTAETLENEYISQNYEPALFTKQLQPQAMKSPQSAHLQPNEIFTGMAQNLLNGQIIRNVDPIKIPSKSHLAQKFEILHRVYKWKEGTMLVASCKKCQKLFKAQNGCSVRSRMRLTLQRHLRTHVERNPFSCSYCEFTNKHAGNMKIHIQKEHPYLPLRYKDETDEDIYISECLSVIEDCFEITEEEMAFEREKSSKFPITDAEYTEQDEEYMESMSHDVPNGYDLSAQWNEENPQFPKSQDASELKRILSYYNNK